jgi:hypothetical protein
VDEKEEKRKVLDIHKYYLAMLSASLPGSSLAGGNIQIAYVHDTANYPVR